MSRPTREQAIAAAGSCLAQTRADQAARSPGEASRSRLAPGCIWLLERRRRAEAALTSGVASCYLLGVSTRRMERLVESLGITRLSTSQVSAMAADLDEQMAAFRTRPLDAGPYTFLAADALVLEGPRAGVCSPAHRDAMLRTAVPTIASCSVAPRRSGRGCG
jgi:hypothetical protein